MSFAPALPLADSVLLEGYVLYPYRASSTKNRYRFTFGVIAPRAYAEANGERWWSEARFLYAPAEGARDEARAAPLSIRVRFLHHASRVVEACACAGAGVGACAFVPASSLDVDGELHASFDEAVTVERDYDVDLEQLLALAPGAHVSHELWCHASRTVEVLRDEAGVVRGRRVRSASSIKGRVDVRAERSGHGLVTLVVRVENAAPWSQARARRDDVLPSSFLSLQVLAHARRGRFLSVLDPPAWALPAAEACRTRSGLYPVLVGAAHESDLALAAPIVLYDHAQIAPESPGDFCDACEIDELLALRARTLTDDEKREARATDAVAAAIVDRADALEDDALAQLHGAARGRSHDEMVPALPARAPATSAWDQRACDYVVGEGVILRPGKRRTDAQDMLYAGMRATVERIEQDVDGDWLLAVTIDEDPAREQNRAKRRYQYWRVDEVEKVPRAPRSTPYGAPQSTPHGAPQAEQPAVPRVLVAGIGNLFFSDDAFGLDVVARLRAAPGSLPADVEVDDYGIRGVHLAYRLTDKPPALLVLVDACARGEAPGTLSVIEPQDVENALGPCDASHALAPESVFSAVRALGGTMPRVLIVACEPLVVDEGIGLSEPVARAVIEAESLVRDLVVRELEVMSCRSEVETTPSP